MSDGIHRFLPNDEYQAAIGANSPSAANVYATMADIIAGSSPVLTGETLWVDSVHGDDATGVNGRQDKPYLTIGAAITASNPGDLVSVRPGTYPETATLDVTGISLISEGGWEHTTIGDGSATAYDIIQLGDQGYIQGFSVLVPNSVQAAIECNQVSGTNSVYDITLYGTGTTGPGTGINRTGGGKTIGANIRVEGGGMANALRVDSGVLALEGIHVPQSAGTIDNVLLCTVNAGPTTGGRAQMIGFNTGSTNVTNAIRTEGGTAGISFNPTALIFTPNIFNATNALSTDGVYQTTNLLGGRIENVTYAVNVDIGATGVGLENSIYRITSNHQPNYIYNPEVAGKSEFTLTYIQEPTSEFDSSFNVFGADQFSAGFSEKGIESSFGKGAPFTTGLVAFTSDSALSSTDGNNITDITADVISKSGSTFTFPTGATSDTITFGSRRYDVSSNALKWWGLEMLVNTAATGNLGDYVFEIWDGTTTAWRIVSCMATSAEEGYPYGNAFFRRGNPGDESKEFYRLGATNDTAYNSVNNFKFADIDWQPKSITVGGTPITAYWCRIRTTVPNGAPVSYPIFERCKIIDSAFNVSKVGIPSGTGLGMFRKTIALSGRLWSGNLSGMGSLGDYATTVGDTAGDNWGFEINQSTMGNGQEINVQFPIPIGTCTAFPIKIKCAMNFDGGGMDLASDPHVIEAYALPQATTGNFIADPSGAKTLTKRDFSDADLLSAAGSRNPNLTTLNINGTNNIIEGAVTATTWASLENKVHEIELAEVDISEYYENDLILFNISFVSGGSDITPFSLIVEGVFHQDGAGI